ncbi:uncharacterized membrane-anchored protein YitT (DUF2179 family) [Mobilisporobacter senegalensis]|uniref:Uncharacterized membrane-anchored protein YitT (DUF2179 family) n=1 Tax=Mobilisporobacter senegalensis TaxID=1329262 RepID=A0A3N1XP42_9FIRM|nr:YitT family protein [Mobilisporobacter senegalensis]ROR28433.1 uncharacterized membrane-anchored protein YitT (DUF2179 family) [Mobilisporobacter senegalensis]
MKKGKEFILLTISTLIIAIGVYIFKFPNNFSFGGVTGIAVILGKMVPLTPGAVTFAINMILLVFGFGFLGKSFGIKTVYVSILMSAALWALEYIYPLQGPLTDEPMLELAFAVALPSFGQAILFNIGASSGGTDIVAMILRKYSNIDIGRALFLSDLVISVAAWPIFGAKTGLFSLLGLMIKTLVIDGVIESINLCKYFNVVCDNPEPICDFIVNRLHRSASIIEAKGAFSHKDKYIILTVLRRSQAVQLRMFIRQIEPEAFLMISNTSEIIGRGFRH